MIISESKTQPIDGTKTNNTGIMGTSSERTNEVAANKIIAAIKYPQYMILAKLFLNTAVPRTPNQLRILADILNAIQTGNAPNTCGINY